MWVQIMTPVHGVYLKVSLADGTCPQGQEYILSELFVQGCQTCGSCVPNIPAACEGCDDREPKLDTFVLNPQQTCS